MKPHKKQILFIAFVLFTSSIPFVSFVHAEDQAFVLKWSYSANPSVGFGIGPLAVDINNDGIMEIFILSANGSQREILCLNGSNGDVIWSINPGVHVVPHNPMGLYDLNNNGKYELVVPSPGALSVYHAENGTLWWRNTSIKCSEAHQLVLDTDGTGYPYIYTVNASSTTGEHAFLRKVNASTGKAIISVPYHYACHGGLTAGDVNNNGSYLIFGSDRNYNGGKGLRCYDADTLELKWYRSDIFCSSHLPVLYDVTGDGILEVIISKQRHLTSAGLYVLNALTGENIPGMYQNSISGMAIHEQLAVHRFSTRNDVYVATGCYNYGDGILIFNLNNWSVDANLGYAGRPPYFANVMGDQELEIIVSTEVKTIRIYDHQFQLVQTIPMPGGASCLTSIVQDIDGDGLNELITVSSDGVVRVYDTLVQAASPLPRTQTNHYGEMNTRAAVYTPLPMGGVENHAPTISNPNPTDKLTNVPLSVSSLSITINDADGDAIDYIIQTSPHIGSVSVQGASSGIKYCSISSLSYSTTYTWYVKAFDGQQWTNRSFSFTTIAENSIPPQISNILFTTSNPIDMTPGFGWENISCVVSDTKTINNVLLKLTKPDGSTQNLVMNKKYGTDVYYHNTTFLQYGTFSYYIWANNTNNNQAVSDSYIISKPPNWDINNNGRCSILDLSLISNKIGETGAPGWIREDVDNNGKIELIDFLIVLDNYGTTWKP